MHLLIHFVWFVPFFVGVYHAPTHRTASFVTRLRYSEPASVFPNCFGSQSCSDCDVFGIQTANSIKKRLIHLLKPFFAELEDSVTM